MVTSLTAAGAQRWVYGEEGVEFGEKLLGQKFF